MNHRIFERTLRPLVFWRACLFERHFNPQAPGLVLGIGVPLSGAQPMPPAPKFSGGLAVVPLCVVAHLALEPAVAMP